MKPYVQTRVEHLTVESDRERHREGERQREREREREKEREREREREGGRGENDVRFDEECLQHVHKKRQMRCFEIYVDKELVFR